jgi:pimeloyl-ACP methyl ester carboxylesterase
MTIKIQVTNATIALDDVGEGTPVLLLHGFPATPHLWSRVVPLLGNSGYRLLVPRAGSFRCWRAASAKARRCGRCCRRTRASRVGRA